MFEISQTNVSEYYLENIVVFIFGDIDFLAKYMFSTSLELVLKFGQSQRGRESPERHLQTKFPKYAFQLTKAVSAQWLRNCAGKALTRSLKAPGKFIIENLPIQ